MGAIRRLVRAASSAWRRSEPRRRSRNSRGSSASSRTAWCCSRKNCWAGGEHELSSHIGTCRKRQLSCTARPCRTPAGAILSAPRRFRAVSTSASSPAAPPAWICCSSIGRMTAGPRASFPSIPQPTAPITTGTCSCRACSRARSTAIASTDRSIPRRGLRFDSSKLLLDPYGRGVVVPQELQPRRRTACKATTPRRP